MMTVGTYELIYHYNGCRGNHPYSHSLVSYKIELDHIGCTLEPVSVINANGAVLYILFYFVHCTIWTALVRTNSTYLTRLNPNLKNRKYTTPSLYSENPRSWFL